SGIGAELATQLARQGALLVLAARRVDRLEAVARECRAAGAEAHVVAADLAHEAEGRSLIEKSVAALGGIDVLVLTAGAGHRGRLEALDDLSILSNLMQINYLGPAYCARHALPHLKASHGTLAVVSSLQGKAGFPGYTAYSASKHALHGFFDALRS